MTYPCLDDIRAWSRRTVEGFGRNVFCLTLADLKRKGHGVSLERGKVSAFGTKE